MIHANRLSGPQTLERIPLRGRAMMLGVAVHSEGLVMHLQLLLHVVGAAEILRLDLLRDPLRQRLLLSQTRHAVR